MKNKGFTLIELIGTLVILSLMLLIVTPLVTKNLRTSLKKTDIQTKENIKLAAKNWMSDHKEEVNQIKVSKLIEEGYLDDEVKLPSTSENINKACIKVIKTYDNQDTGKKIYKYEYEDNCN